MNTQAELQQAMRELQSGKFSQAPVIMFQSKLRRKARPWWVTPFFIAFFSILFPIAEKYSIGLLPGSRKSADAERVVALGGATAFAIGETEAQ